MGNRGSTMGPEAASQKPETKGLVISVIVLGVIIILIFGIKCALQTEKFRNIFGLKDQPLQFQKQLYSTGSLPYDAYTVGSNPFVNEGWDRTAYNLPIQQVAQQQGINSFVIPSQQWGYNTVPYGQPPPGPPGIGVNPSVPMNIAAAWNPETGGVVQPQGVPVPLV